MMAYQQRRPRQTNSSGAGYVPNGYDDYYMPPKSPELVSPAPQR